MRSFPCSALLFSLSLLLSLLATENTVGDELRHGSRPMEVSVTLVDGLSLTAIADAATSDEFLVLRFTSAGILLRRQIAWNQVQAATLNARRLTATEFKDALKVEIPDAGIDPLAELLVQASSPPHDVATASDRVATVFPAPAVVVAVPSETSAGRIRSLEVLAETANWDRDAAIDGIRLYVRPLDAVGEVVPIDGHVNVELFGQAFLQAGGVRNNRSFDAFPALGEWSQRVRRRDFSVDGAVYQFEFRRTNPEFLREIGSYGLTHVRLSVAGQGVFEASDAMTRVRPFSVYRDWHEQLTGHRFLPAEHLLPRE